MKVHDYKIGNRYERLDGTVVKLVQYKDEDRTSFPGKVLSLKGYETVMDENECHYYMRSTTFNGEYGYDHGRATGCKEDDPRNLKRLYTKE